MDFGLIVDLETTGLDPEAGRIIEIGLIEFAVEGDELPVVTRSYGALQDPGIPLPPEVTRITGIAPGHVVGQAIDWNIVASFFSRASIVIAHNAEFDRAFLTAHWQRTNSAPANMPHWACSMRHIDWKKHNFNTQALNYLAADHGFVNPFAHRALFDCATTFRLISPYLKELIARSYEREVVVKAVNSPFESKDVLRARGYRWDPNERCWGKVIAESGLNDERQFLAADVYKGEPRHFETVIEH